MIKLLLVCDMYTQARKEETFAPHQSCNNAFADLHTLKSIRKPNNVLIFVFGTSDGFVGISLFHEFYFGYFSRSDDVI